jgi:2-methylisocitrate lyase-like PEP mutase family enzyme
LSSQLSGSGNVSSQLRRCVERRELVVAPGCYDVVSAKALLASGMSAAYLTPFGFRASDQVDARAPRDPWKRLLGRAEAMLACGPIVLVFDAHTGLEGSRTVTTRLRDAAATGAAAIVVEDRIGFGMDRPFRSIRSMQRQIDSARRQLDADVVLVVRTDIVRASLVEARERCRCYLNAGADLVMPLMTPYLDIPDSPPSRARRMAAYHFLLEEVPAHQLVVHSPAGRHLSVDEAARLGFGLYLMPQLMIAASVTAMMGELAHLRDRRTGAQSELIGPARLSEIVGTSSWLRARW